MNELVILECNMEKTDELFMENAFDTSTSMVNYIEKIIAFIRDCVTAMILYAQTLKLDITKNISTVKLKLAINSMKKKIEAGSTVYLPDLKGITNKYRGVIKELQSEMRGVAKELSKFKLRENDRIDNYIYKKDEFRNKLDALVSDIDVMLNKPITVTSRNASEINSYASNLLKETELYISEYTKLIRDIEKIAIDFERNTKQAEIAYNYKQSTRNNMGKIAAIKHSATKLLRKTVFTVCAIIA